MKIFSGYVDHYELVELHRYYSCCFPGVLIRVAPQGSVYFVEIFL